MAIAVSRRDLARVFTVYVDRITVWRHEGLDVARLRDGTYDLERAVAWFRENKLARPWHELNAEALAELRRKTAPERKIT
jgi:phage terminase Nu1 subunit (DNA packaging protein)